MMHTILTEDEVAESGRENMEWVELRAGLEG
jgi:hypothetical protein